MKPIKARSFFIRDLLYTLAILCTVFGFIFLEKTVPFSYSIWGHLKDGNIEQPILLGIVPLNFITTYISFLCAYLLFEFYGFKTALYASLNLVVAILGTYGIFWLMQQYYLDPIASKTDEIILSLIKHDIRTLIAVVAPLFIGFFSTFFLAAIIKRITRNYFMFFRFTIASIIGFSLFIMSHTYLNYFDTYALRSMLIYMVTPAAQFLLAISASVIPLYLLRLILGMFRGWQKHEDDTEMATSGGMFKGAEPQTAAASEASVEDLPPPPSVTDDEEVTTPPKEITVSQKINVDDIASNS
jgi:hypothetical protein